MEDTRAGGPHKAAPHSLTKATHVRVAMGLAANAAIARLMAPTKNVGVLCGA